MRVCFVGFGGIAQAIASLMQKQGHNIACVSRHSKKDVVLELGYEYYDNCYDCFQASEPDCVIHTIGMLHDDNHAPEKSIAQMNRDWFLKSMEINAYSLVETTQALYQNTTKNSATKLIALSARVSSITDNHLGGWHSYRMSKIALNMLIKNISLEWKFSRKNSTVIGWHPGTVDTDITAPFRARVKPEKLFTPEQSAQYLLNFLSSLSVSNSGKIYTWEHKVLEP